jgi:thiol-disulfide isomerase/thioredoxin
MKPWLTLSVLIALAGTVRAQEAPTEPAAFLKWSMDRHAALTVYQATVSWRLQTEGVPDATPPTPRTIAYEAPNRFRIVSGSGKERFDYACDGTTFFHRDIRGNVYKIGAPVSLAVAADAHPMIMLGMPFFGGSALYDFFGGGARFDALLNESAARSVQKHPPTPLTFGPDTRIGEESCRTVIFGGGLFHDRRRAVIGVRDGLVRRLEYVTDAKTLSAQAVAERRAQMKTFLASAAFRTLPAEQRQALREQFEAMAAKDPASVIVETIDTIDTHTPIAPETFTLPLDAGTRVQDLGVAAAPRTDSAPAFVGKPSPDIRVTALGGGAPVALSSLRGRIVVIDFWATWCPPCRKGLPDTLRLHKSLTGKGVSVLAITDEKPEIVRSFVANNGFKSLPVFVDSDRSASKSFAVTAIPTMVVIDRAGNVVAYFVGLQDHGTVVDALKKAGLSL